MPSTDEATGILSPAASHRRATAPTAELYYRVELEPATWEDRRPLRLGMRWLKPASLDPGPKKNIERIHSNWCIDVPVDVSRRCQVVLRYRPTTANKVLWAAVNARGFTSCLRGW